MNTEMINNNASDPQTDQRAEAIKKDYEQFRKLCNKLGTRTENVNKMLDFFGERLFFAPASSDKSFHCAFPGGLINHSLRVLSNFIKLSKTFDLKISQETTILCCLFHDFGKIGSLTEDLYIPQKEAWLLKKGKEYSINDNISYMPNSQRTLFLFQHFNILLSEDEYLSILLNDGVQAKENQLYSFRQPILSIYLHMADYLATMQEKEQNL